MYSIEDYREMFIDCGFDVPKGLRGNRSCPKHTDKHPSMSIDVSRGLFHCYSCGYSGRIDNVYKEMFGHQYGKKVNYSEAELRALFSRRERPQKVQTRSQLFKAEIQRYDDPIYKKWLNYRGIKPSVADSAGAFYGAVTIHWVNDEGENKTYTVHDRVMFPIYDENHKMCSIEMRFPLFGSEPQRFISACRKVLYPKCSTVNLLYEQDKLDKTKRLYILEGLMDCLAFRSLTGIKNSTSIFGALFTEKQKALLQEFPEICYVYNNDVAGLNSVESMKQFYKGKLLLLKPAGDYDDVGDMAKAKFTGVEEWMGTISTWSH